MRAHPSITRSQCAKLRSYRQFEVGDKSLRQHSGTMGRPNAIRYIEEIIANNEPISTWQIRNIHNGRAVAQRR